MTRQKPSIVFDVSGVFHRYFVYRRKITPAESRRLKLCKNKIEKIFREKEQNIMSTLQKTFGATTESEIRVWIIDGKMQAPSISKPLLLKYKKNANFMLYVLVHELAHRYLDAGVRWRGKRSDWLQPGIKLESLCHLAAETALGSDFTEQLGNELDKIKKYDEIKTFMEKNTGRINAFLGSNISEANR